MESWRADIGPQHITQPSLHHTEGESGHRCVHDHWAMNNLFFSLLAQSFKCWWPPEGQKHYKDVFHLISGNCFRMCLLQRPRSSFFQPQETEAQKIGGALTLVIPFNLCFLTLNSRTLSNALAWNIIGFNCAELTESLLETEGAHMVSCESSPKSLREHCLPAAFNEQIKPMCK